VAFLFYVATCHAWVGGVVVATGTCFWGNYATFFYTANFAAYLAAATSASCTCLASMESALSTAVSFSTGGTIGDADGVELVAGH
jgi:hypothetical protein